MEGSIISHIFNLDEFENDEVLNSYDILILNKILEEEDKIAYLNDCYSKSLNYENCYKDLAKQYLSTFIFGDIEMQHKKDFENWVLDNKFDYWDIITSNKNAESIYFGLLKNYSKMNDSDVKYYNIKKLLSIDHIQDFLKQKRSLNGMDEQQNGPFSWFIQKPFNPNIDVLFDTLEPLYSKKKNLDKLLNRIKYILNLNKAFSYSDFNRIDVDKTSSTTFMYIILRILIKLLIKYSDKNLKFTKSFPRNDFKMYTTDCTFTKIFILTCKAYFTCYNYQLIVYDELNYSIKRLNNKINSIKLMNNDSYTRTLFQKLEDLKKKFNLIEQIVLNGEYKKDIEYFIEHYIQKKIHINDEFIDSLTLASLRQLKYLNDYNISHIIRDYYLNLIGGDTVNPHIRYNAMIYILDIIDIKGFMGMHVNILTKIFKYLSEVNFFDNYSPESVHDHLINIMSTISRICILMNKNDIPKYEENYSVVFKGIHKMASKIMDYLELINQIVKNIKSKPHLMTKPLLLVRSYGEIIENTMIRITTIISTLASVLQNIIGDIDQLNIELIMPINTLIIQIFKFFSEGSNPIYTIFKKNMESLEIMTTAFNIINVIKENKIFKREIYEYIEIIKDMIPRIKLQDNIKNDLDTYFKNFQDIEDYIDYKLLPNEFIDPILCTQIRDPIMIPHVDLIFDKSSILSQLYHENINPYTREPLTLEDIEQYNNLPNVIEKINIFKCNFDVWKKNNIKK